MSEHISAIELGSVLELEERAEDLLDAGQYGDAIAIADSVLAVDPKSISAWLARGSACKSLNSYWDAAIALEAALALAPGFAVVRINIGNIYAALEWFSKAEDHLLKAIAQDASLVAAHASLGSVYIRMARYDLAESPTRCALFLDPSNGVANQNLAAIAAWKEGPHTEVCSLVPLSEKQFFIERAQSENAPTALILSSSGNGNIPYQYLVPRAKYGRILWYIDHAPPGQELELPHYDFAFNVVGDPDSSLKAQQAIEHFASRCTLPLLNRSDRVARTRRSILPSFLGHIDNIVVPPAKYFSSMDGNVIDAILRSGLRFPLIVRPTGSHGGDGVKRIDTSTNLATQIPAYDEIYATEFFDYRSFDNWYRKYRVIFIDRKPHAYHLAIGANWSLHYWTAGMENDAVRREEERMFLEYPERSLGVPVWKALSEIAAVLDLDYAGIDFSLLPDGRLLFFEANATMLVHPEDNAVMDYKNNAVRRILKAMDTMIADKLAVKTRPDECHN